MPYMLPMDDPEIALPPVRWKRGLFVDVDPEYRKAILKLGAIEVPREEAIEIATDDSVKPKAHKKG